MEQRRPRAPEEWRTRSRRRTERGRGGRRLLPQLACVLRIGEQALDGGSESAVATAEDLCEAVGVVRSERARGC